MSMLVNSFEIATGTSSAIFIGAGAATPGASYNPTWPGSPLAGDLAIIYCTEQSSSPSGSGWTVLGPITWSTNTDYLMYKILSSGDISSPPSLSVRNGASVIIHIYRSTSNIILKNSAFTSLGSSASCSGFTTTGLTKGVISFEVDRQSTGTAAVSSPPSSNSRIADYNASSLASLSSADWLTGSYSSGATVVWSGSTTTFYRIVSIFELQ